MNNPHSTDTWDTYLPNEPVWKHWLAPEKGQGVFKNSVVDLPNLAEAQPTDTSWCVLMMYISEGR